MNRKKFLSFTGLSLTSLFIHPKAIPMQQAEPEVYYFKDDGKIPNSKYPVLIYRNAFTARGDEGASWLEQTFAAHNWTNSWRNGIYPFHHYHSTSHEVLGVYNGSVLVQLGGESGKKLKIQAGDIVIIPAGVGHKNLGDDNL